MESIGNDSGAAGPADGPEEHGPGLGGILWILAGLVVTGIAAGYHWWRRLAK